MTTATLQIQNRVDTAALWSTSNPVLLSAEIGYESDTGLMKIGDGVTAWNSLAYWGTFDSVQVNNALAVDGTLTIDSAGTQPVATHTDLLFGGSANIAANGGLNFYIDADNDQTAQEFTWRHNAGAATGAALLMTLNDSGNLSVTGAVTGSNLNVSNWDTAFGWGDHAGLYAAASHTHLLAAGATDVTATAAEVNLLDLAALTVNDVLVASSASTAAWRQLVEADISDFGSYADASHTHLLAAGATDVTATAAELNLLDLAGLTAGWVLSADTATTASWKAPTAGVSALADLTDVVSATNTDKFALMANGTTGYVGRALVEADISDFGSYAAASHTHLLAAGATDVTATAAELNLLDLAGLTAGWVLSADTATTASWKAPTGGGASALADLTDVVSATNTNRFALMANGTTGYVGRALVEADISDLGSYLPLGGGTATGRIIINNTEDVAVGSLSGPLIIGGDGTAAHIAIDNNEIMAKATASTAATLNLNVEGGLVNIGSGGLTVAGNTNVTGGNLSIPTALRLYLDGGGDTYFIESTSNTVRLFTGGVQRLQVSTTFAINTAASVNGALSIPAASRLYLDGGSNTYIQEVTADVLGLFAANASPFQVTSTTAEFTKGVSEQTQSFSTSGTQTMNLANANYFYVSGALGTNSITFAFSNVPASTRAWSCTLELIDADGATITWPTVTWVGGAAPTLSANRDFIVFFGRTGTTTIYAQHVGST